MAKKRNENRALIRLIEQQANTQKKDIGTWNTARRQAINVDNPRRTLLYDVYADAMLDLHLSGCIGQRKGMTMKKSFALCDRAGKQNDDTTEILNTQWFKDFISYTLDSKYYGYSLIELGNIVEKSGKPAYDKVTLINRKHVVPEFGVFLQNQTDDFRQGIPYTEGELAQWCIGTGNTHDLGLLLKCAPQALSKKNMMAFWDKFGELFGMPMRIAKTNSTDPAELSRINEMLIKMGAFSYGLFPDGTDIDLKATSQGDAYNVYDRRIERANYELSKCILNQTMTIDNGGSYSQSEVHLEVFKNICDADADFVRDTVNNELLPRMEAHGFPVKEMQFNWNESIDYTPEQQIQIDRMVLENFEVEPNYVVEKYGIPVTGKKATAPMGGLASQFEGIKLASGEAFNPFE